MLLSMNEHRQPADSLTVYVVDADTAVREGLGVLLAETNVAVKTYASAEEFLSDPPVTASGCLVAEVHLPGMDGLELLANRGAGHAHGCHGFHRQAVHRSGAAQPGSSGTGDSEGPETGTDQLSTGEE